MRFASVTSCAAVSSGTLPISLRYMRTGSKLPPSVCVTRGARPTGIVFSSSAASVSMRVADAAPGRLVVEGRCSRGSTRRVAGSGAAGTLPARR